MFLPSVTFATSCWEKDWQLILQDPNYLKEKQIGNHCFAFAETILVINNVENLERVKEAAQKKVDEGVLTRYVVAEEKVLEHFQLKRSDFRPDVGIKSDWVYYNALGPLTAICECKSDYLLYVTGDVFLEGKVRWIPKALRVMEKHPEVQVANLTWNRDYKGAKQESYTQSWNFYWAKRGFSDQMFLVGPKFKKLDFKEIRSDCNHFPRGDVFEKRAASCMINRDWERITYRWGSYTHENV